MKRAEPGWLVLSLAGLAALLGSFLPFYTFSGGVDATVWSRGLFPTATLIPLLGFAIGLEALFVLLRGHEPRSPFLNFTWEQVRLAVGAVMILLALSYLVQDRAGGTLGVGYLVLSLSALATFVGGVMTRRVQLARAPGEEAPVRETRPLLKPAVATVGRMGSEFAKSVTGARDNVKTRLASRKEARTEARAAAAEKAAAAATVAAAAKAKADAKAAAAAKVEADAKAAAAAKVEADAKAAAAAKADVAAKTEAATKAEAAPTADAPAAETPAMQPPPPTETFDVPPSELPGGAESVDVEATEPPPPSETFDLPPAEPPPAPEKLAEEPPAAADHASDMVVEETTKPIPTIEESDKTAEAPSPEPAASVEEVEKVVEEPAAKPVEEPALKEPEETEKPPRVAPLSAVSPKPDPDATAPLETGTSPSDSDSTDAGDTTAPSKPKGARRAPRGRRSPRKRKTKTTKRRRSAPKPARRADALPAVRLVSSTSAADGRSAHPQIVRTATNHTSTSRPTMPIPTQPSTIPAIAIPRPRLAPPEFSMLSRARWPRTIETIPGITQHQKNSPVTSDAIASPLVCVPAAPGYAGAPAPG